MGAFDVEFTCRHGKTCTQQHCANTLMWPAQDWLLRKMLPTQSGTLSYQLGFSGAPYRTKDKTPNPDDATFTFDRRLTLDDVTFNEGGSYSEEIREMFGYERRDITWTVSRDGTGALIDTGWEAWTNQVTWAKHGDWSASPPEPDDWIDCPLPYRQDHRFPWCTPPIQTDWWTDNEFSVDCPDCEEHDPWSISHYPIGLVFVTLQKSGESDRLMAAALLPAPIHWRLGGTIRVRYRGRLGS